MVSKLLEANGRITPEGREHLINRINGTQNLSRPPCCRRPSMQLLDTVGYLALAAFGDTNGQDLRQLSKGVPCVMVVCASCGHITSYALKTVLPDLEEWLGAAEGGSE